MSDRSNDTHTELSNDALDSECRWCGEIHEGGPEQCRGNGSCVRLPENKGFVCSHSWPKLGASMIQRGVNKDV